MSNLSRKVAAVELVREQIIIRRPHPMDQSKYIPSEHFLPYEESAYLRTALQGEPYVSFTTDNPDYMQELLIGGYNVPGVGHMKVVFGYWKDSEGHAILVPVESKFDDLRQLGVVTVMKSMADCFKVGKYSNRLFAPLPKGVDAVWGHEFDWDADTKVSWVMIEPSNDKDTRDEVERTITVKYVNLKDLDHEQKALVDGAIAVSPKGAVALGLTKKPLLGQAWRGTFGTRHGLGKGHILLVPWLDHDVVIYGQKSILTTDHFYFGNMGELHVGIPHTDAQSFVNFGYHRQGLAYELAHAWMIKIWNAAKDERALRRLLLAHTEDMTNEQLGEEGWVLRRCLRYGVSMLRFPGVFRRVVRYLTTKVMQIEERARIPMDTVAAYGYVLPDPFAINSEGDVDLDQCQIGDGQMVFPDVVEGTEVALYRQPSENSNAHYFVNVALPGSKKQRRQYQRFAGRGVCLLGRGADKVLNRLGGGDMDDSFVIVFDPTWVKAFHELSSYPETEKVKADNIADVPVSYEEIMGIKRQSLSGQLEDAMKQETMAYSTRHIGAQIEMSRRSRSGIGPVVNYGIVDFLLSDPEHKASMLLDLQKNPPIHDWLATRRDYQAAKLMTNLELVIDGNVKDPTLLAQLGDIAGQIKEFHANCPVYPKSQWRRMPVDKQQNAVLGTDYVLARSFMCRTLDAIEQDRVELMELFKKREWYLVGPADKVVRDSYPRSSFIVKLVNGANPRKVEGLRGWWRDEWRERFEKLAGITDPAVRSAMEKTQYKEVTDLLKDMLDQHDDETKREIAIEVYLNTYKRVEPNPRLDVNGKVRTFNDGLLWSPELQNHFIDALRLAKVDDKPAPLCGFYAPCDVRSELRKALKDKAVVVQVKNHNVYLDEAPSIWVGTALQCPNGRFIMDAGLIEVRRPSAMCQPLNEALVQEPVVPVSVVPQMPTVTEEAPRVEDNIFTRLMKRALRGIAGQ